MSDAQLNDHGSIPVNIKNKNRQCKYFSMSLFLSSTLSLLSYSFRHQHYGHESDTLSFLSDPVRQESGTSLLSDSARQHYGQKPGTTSLLSDFDRRQHHKGPAMGQEPGKSSLLFASVRH